MICLKAKINRINIILCNINAPNIGDAIFFHKINKIVGDISGDRTIIAGDFNQVLDAALHRTTFSTNKPKDRMAIKLMMKDFGLVDIWRVVNPKEREYTFFSHKHKSQSRIDYFLISNNLVENTSDCTIGPIALTNNPTVHLGMILEPEVVRQSRWRLNVSLLQNPDFLKLLEDELDSFFELNIGSTEKIGTVWEASKAFVRGK